MIALVLRDDGMSTGIVICPRLVTAASDTGVPLLSR